MALESEIRGDKGRIKIISTNKWAKTVISLSIGFTAGLSMFLLINTIYTAPSTLVPSPSALPLSSQSAVNNAEAVDAVALCKAGVIKYTPLGAYPGGSDDVKAALNYCNSLG
ncbi:hypothetical protein BH18THE2_BH18THE2_43100 [soil metagenome]